MSKEYREIFNLLQDAIISRSVVTIEYNDYKDNKTTRSIMPLRFEMIERKSNFYDRLCLKAFCNLRKDERIFAVYRISSIKFE
ncbi:WYL domain-containing protein [Alphaproteobacteria bacterium]|nr:WYL domain-containing protein [Alphaproteobacteria bacterium]